MRAVEMGHRDVAMLLLQKGADVNARAVDGWTPMMTAATRRDVEMTRLLGEHGAGMTVTAAALLGDVNEVQSLLETAPEIPDGPMALIMAARDAHEDVVKLLLEKCPVASAREPCGSAALLFAVRKNNAGIVRALLDKGADVNAADSVGRSALHYAAYAGDAQIVHLLLDNGANVNIVEWSGDTPLVGAVTKGSVEVVKALLEKGASLKAGGLSHDVMEIARRKASQEVLEILKAHALKPSEN